VSYLGLAVIPSAKFLSVCSGMPVSRDIVLRSDRLHFLSKSRTDSMESVLMAWRIPQMEMKVKPQIVLDRLPILESNRHGNRAIRGLQEAMK
jgi:hypothetical protein